MAAPQLRRKKRVQRHDGQALVANLQRGLPCSCPCHLVHLGPEHQSPHPGERCLCKRARVARA